MGHDVVRKTSMSFRWTAFAAPVFVAALGALCASCDSEAKVTPPPEPASLKPAATQKPTPATVVKVLVGKGQRVEAGEPLQAECAHFLECVRERKTPLTDGRNGLMVVKILESAQQSMESGGVEISLK